MVRSDIARRRTVARPALNVGSSGPLVVWSNRAGRYCGSGVGSSTMKRQDLRACWRVAEEPARPTFRTHVSARLHAPRLLPTLGRHRIGAGHYIAHPDAVCRQRSDCLPPGSQTALAGRPTAQAKATSHWICHGSADRHLVPAITGCACRQPSRQLNVRSARRWLICWRFAD